MQVQAEDTAVAIFIRHVPPLFLGRPGQTTSGENAFYGAAKRLLHTCRPGFRIRIRASGTRDVQQRLRTTHQVGVPVKQWADDPVQQGTIENSGTAFFFLGPVLYNNSPIIELQRKSRKLTHLRIFCVMQRLEFSIEEVL